LTGRDLEQDDCNKLFNLHDKYKLLKTERILSQLEGVYYPLKIVEDPFKTSGSGCYIGTSRKGWKRIDRFANNLMDLKIIRMHGKFYKGEEFRTKIYEPSDDELKNEILGKIKEAKSQYPNLKGNAGWLVSVVHLCLRGMCFMETSRIASKTASVEWFLERNPGQP